MTLKNAEKDIEQLTQQYDEFKEIEQALLENYHSKGVNDWADVWEDSVSQYAKETVVIDIDENIQISYQELDQLANKVATWCDSKIREDLAFVGIYAPNSIAFLAAVLGLYKIGKIAVLFNPQETHQGVSRIAKQYGIFDVMTHQVGHFKSPSITTHEILSVLQEDLSITECAFQRSGISLDDIAMIIFTSGTSGFKKPALFSHKRMMTAGVKWSQRIGMKQQDRCYIPLPLCHGNGLVLAFSSCMTAGATAVIRKRFSVKNFLPDIRQYGCSSAVYIGELWQYLLAQPENISDSNNPLRVIFGNGLKYPLWEPVAQRFGIEHILEHYGATEMPGDSINNWTGRPGYCGFIPPQHPDAQEIMLIDQMGNPVPNGEAGEALFHVPQGRYKGYLDPRLDAEKLWKTKDGKIWWRSGDLLRRTEEGFFSFVERLGDSYRWKGENVSPREVEDVLRATCWFSEVAVYGIKIPHYDGKAGMASLVPHQKFLAPELDKLLTSLQEELPSFAIPRFIRIMSNLQITETLKIKKSQFAAEGFDLMDKFPHYVLHNGSYSPMTKETIQALENKQLRL